MKKLLLILMLLTGRNAKAQIVTASITVTNTATNGMTFSVNGAVRTWTNSVTSASTQILTSSNIISTASNLFNSYVLIPLSQVIITKTGSNSINFQGYNGTAMVIAFGGPWASVSYNTNSITNTTVVRVPKSVAGNYEQTNVESGLIDYLNDNKMGTNIIKPGATAFSNFISTNTIYSGIQRLASNISSVTVSGLAIGFTPSTAFATIAGTNVDFVLTANVKRDTITTNGATFLLDALTDSTNYFIQYLLK